MKQMVRFLIVCTVLLSAYVWAEPGVNRSAFTTDIENKEPVSDLKQVTTDTRRIYFFTEILGLDGHAIIHRWEYNNQVLAEVSFQVGANRWRTWSSKSMLASWTGTWQVSVLDEGGNIIDQSRFEYIAPDSKPDSPSAKADEPQAKGSVARGE